MPVTVFAAYYDLLATPAAVLMAEDLAGQPPMQTVLARVWAEGMSF